MLALSPPNVVVQATNVAEANLADYIAARHRLHSSLCLPAPPAARAGDDAPEAGEGVAGAGGKGLIGQPLELRLASDGTDYDFACRPLGEGKRTTPCMYAEKRE
ncbi:hypothetical protein GGQ59_002473 [Parvularcula dongshanensis]|uniref:Uncharacterized protein n=1 Tax=Parvularcula dongshanensis TaxID=1173995 RepID=A0A840I684_9PROT|nr:hypothetical protein [Parvularcula dongshanensis]